MDPKIELGGLSSPFDYRDSIAATAVAETLAGAKLPATQATQLATPMMQAQQPACVSHSAADQLKLFWFRKTGEWVDFSPRFLDTLVKRIDGQDRATGGTYPRMVFKLMAQYGCATEATLPNDTSLPVLEYRDDALLTPTVFAEAAKYKTPGYVQIPLDFQSTRAAIFLYGAVSTLFEIGDEFWLPSWADKDIDPLRTPASIVGGHQISPCGWEDASLNTVQNEWSTAWANGGRNRYNPTTWAPYIREQWAIAEIPPDVADFLKNLPSPANFHYQWNTNLIYGMQSEDVKFAQIALMILGFLAPVEASDLGSYGPKTAAAVGKYQQAHKIMPAPNSVGPLTRAALNTQFAL